MILTRVRFGIAVFVCLSTLGQASDLPSHKLASFNQLAPKLLKSTYQFSLSTFGRAQVIELKQPPSLYHSTFDGDLVVSGPTGSKTLIGSVVIRGLVLTSGTDRLFAEEKLLRASLSKPFVIRKVNGKISACAFSGDTLPEGRKIVRTILSVAGLAGAAKQNSPTFTVDDTVGTKLLSRTVSGQSTLRLSERRYVANTSEAQKLTLKGFWTVKLSTVNTLDFESIHGEEDLDALVTKSSHSYTRLQADIRHFSTTNALKNERLNSVLSAVGPFEPLWVRASEEDLQRALATHTLQGMNSSDVFRIVENLGTHEQSDQSGTDAFSKLRALVIVSDAAAVETGKRLQNAPVRSPQFVAFSQALISAGTTSAQKAFLEALEVRKNDPVAAQKLISQLIGLNHPAYFTVDKIKRLSRDRSNPVLSSSSILILGRFAGKLAGTSPTQSADLIRMLTTGLDSAKESDTQQLYVGALGNAGLDSCFSLLKRFSNSGNAKVRADAVAALRFIKSSAADGLICSHLLHDGSEDVRAAAVFALGFRPYRDENFGSLVVALRNDLSERVRRNALSTLWAQRESQPAIVTIVDEISRTDQSKEIRKTATDLLNIDRGRG